MKAHVIENNVVTNTIEVDSLDFMPNLVEANEGFIGWSYVDGVFSPPVDTRTDEEKAIAIRERRNVLISNSDWMANSDVTMSTEWATYRKSLRDITAHANFPNLQDSDWPIEPEV